MYGILKYKNSHVSGYRAWLIYPLEGFMHRGLVGRVYGAIMVLIGRAHAFQVGRHADYAWPAGAIDLPEPPQD